MGRTISYSCNKASANFAGFAARSHVLYGVDIGRSMSPGRSVLFGVIGGCSVSTTEGTERHGIRSSTAETRLLGSVPSLVAVMARSFTLAVMARSFTLAFLPAAYVAITVLHHKNEALAGVGNRSPSLCAMSHGRGKFGSII